MVLKIRSSNVADEHGAGWVYIGDISHLKSQLVIQPVNTMDYFMKTFTPQVYEINKDKNLDVSKDGNLRIHVLHMGRNDESIRQTGSICVAFNTKAYLLENGETIEKFY